MATISPQHTDDMFRAGTGETEALRALLAQVECGLEVHGAIRLVGPDGTEAAVPTSVLGTLRVIVERMLRGEQMTLLPTRRALSTQEAADILAVSRPHLVKLLDEGAIPHYKVGAHRRVRLQDIMDYRERRSVARADKLDELAQLSEELDGGYR